MHVAYNYLYAINFMHNVYSYIHTTLLLLCRLQNNYLTLMIRISEDTILRADMRKAREEIGIVLLANSGILYH